MSRRVAVADDVDAIPMINPSDGAYAFQDRWGDGSEARHRGAAQRSKCVFCVAPFAALSLAALATGVTYGAMAMSANDKTDFTCDLVRIAPAASVGGCAGLFVLLLVVLFLLRSCWAHAASCSKGRVCAFVGITLLVVLALVAGFGASVISQLVRFFAQQQPSLDGTITINAAQYGGLPTAPVSIVRDSNGLTHIEGATRNDVIFGQGFAQATDRLWQLEFFRLVGKGELSRHVGDAGLSIDKQTRTLGVARAAETMCSAASADTMSALASFAAGVNLFLTTSSARPVEFYFMSESWWPLSRHEPDLFTAQDGCYSAKLLQLNLADNLKMEIDRFRMWWLQGSSASGATYAEINTLYFNQTNITGTILSDSDLGITDADAVARRAWDAQSFAMEAQLYASVFAPMRAASEAAGTLNNKGDGGDGPNDDAASAPGTNKRRPNKYDMVRGLIRKHASNAWTASAGGAASPCGASDPHLDINLPSVWYYNHLAIRPTPGAAPTWESAGVSMTGIPGVHIGKTSSVSWGITMAISDIQDLFVIIPDPARPSTHYMYKNVSTPFTVRTETITYKDGFFGGTKTLTLNILETVYGPNIVPVTELPSDLIISLQSVVMQSDSTSADAVLGFMNPNLKTVNDLCSMVFRRLRSPAFSVPSADASGNLGYCISGAYQVRQQGHTGMWPTLGDGSMDPPSTTQPDVPDSALPHKFVTAAQINAMPVGGTSISAANQKIYPDGYPIALGYDYIPPFRGARIQDLLAASRAANTLSNVATHTTVQSDVQSNIWVKHLKSWFSNLDNATVQFCLPQRAQPVWQQLLAWDGRVNVGDTLPSALWGWLRLMNEVTAPVTDSVKLTPWSEYMFVPSILNMDPTQRSNVAIYFSEALCMKALQEMKYVNPYCSNYFFHQQCWLLGIVQFGVMVDQGYPSKVWGTDLSQLHAVNLMMDGSPLECMFNRQLPKDGDVTSVDVSEFVLNDNPTIYAHAASSMRQIYDWNAPQTVQFSFPGGASGYPYSPYYFNLAPIFQKDQWVPVVVMNGTAGVTSPAHSQTLHP